MKNAVKNFPGEAGEGRAVLLSKLQGSGSPRTRESVSGDKCKRLAGDLTICCDDQDKLLYFIHHRRLVSLPVPIGDVVAPCSVVKDAPAVACNETAHSSVAPPTHGRQTEARHGGSCRAFFYSDSSSANPPVENWPPALTDWRNVPVPSSQHLNAHRYRVFAIEEAPGPDVRGSAVH